MESDGLRERGTEIMPRCERLLVARRGACAYHGPEPSISRGRTVKKSLTLLAVGLAVLCSATGVQARDTKLLLPIKEALN